MRTAHLVTILDLLFLVLCYLTWLLPPDSNPCPADSLSWWNDKAGILFCNSSVPLCITSGCFSSSKHRNTNAIHTWLHVRTVPDWQQDLGLLWGLLSVQHPWLLEGESKQMGQTNISSTQLLLSHSLGLWRAFGHPIPVDPKPSWGYGEVENLPGTPGMGAGALNPKSNLG